MVAAKNEPTSQQQPGHVPEADKNDVGTVGQRFLERFYRATRAVNIVVGNQLQEEFGLELRDFTVLSSIIKGHCYPSDIAKRLHANKFAVSRILQKLTEMGLIGKQIDEHDSRRVLLHATDEGLAVRERALQSVQTRIAPLMDALGEERAELLIGGLDLLIDHFAQGEIPAAAAGSGDKDGNP